MQFLHAAKLMRRVVHSARGYPHEAAGYCFNRSSISENANTCSNLHKNKACRPLRKIDRQRRRRMILSPPLGIRDFHLIAQHIPYGSRLFAIVQRLENRTVVQLHQPLVTRQRPAISAAEHFFQQFPKLTFTHAPSIPHAHQQKNPPVGKPAGYQRGLFTSCR